MKNKQLGCGCAYEDGVLVETCVRVEVNEGELEHLRYCRSTLESVMDELTRRPFGASGKKVAKRIQFLLEGGYERKVARVEHP